MLELEPINPLIPHRDELAERFAQRAVHPIVVTAEFKRWLARYVERLRILTDEDESDGMIGVRTA